MVRVEQCCVCEGDLYPSMLHVKDASGYVHLHCSSLGPALKRAEDEARREMNATRAAAFLRRLGDALRKTR